MSLNVARLDGIVDAMDADQTASDFLASLKSETQYGPHGTGIRLVWVWVVFVTNLNTLAWLCSASMSWYDGSSTMSTILIAESIICVSCLLLPLMFKKTFPRPGNDLVEAEVAHASAGMPIPNLETSGQHAENLASDGSLTLESSDAVEPSDESTPLRPECKRLPGFHWYHMPIFNMVLMSRALQGDVCEMDIDASRWVLFLVGFMVFVSNVTVIFQWALVRWPVTWYFWTEVAALAVAWPTAIALLSSRLRRALIADIVCNYVGKSNAKLEAMWMQSVHNDVEAITLGASAHVDSADVKEQSQKVQFKLLLSQQIISIYELQDNAEYVVSKIDDMNVMALLALLRAKQMSKVWAVMT